MKMLLLITLLFLFVKLFMVESSDGKQNTAYRRKRICRNYSFLILQLLSFLCCIFITEIDTAMIKQDYIVRMIQEIISLIVDAILNKKRIRQRDWEEYDRISRQILGFPTHDLLNMTAQELIDRYSGSTDSSEKIELAAVNMLKMAEEAEDNTLLRSGLRQNSLALFTHLQANTTPSLLRESIIALLRNNG